ncbi:MAG: uroporphyrinogen-III synthase [Thermoprotei archaeon]|jgi:uroporphyrinogen-III synthase
MIRIFLLGTPETSQNIEKELKKIKISKIQLIKIPTIKAVKLKQEIQRTKQILQKFTPQYNIYTSKTAVKIAFRELKQYRHKITKNPITIGTATANMLKKYRIKNVKTPEQHNTQGIIQLLQQLNPTQPIATYSSDQINPQLEKWIKTNIQDSQTFKLYTIRPHKQNIKRLKKFLKQTDDTSILILTSITIINTIKNIIKNSKNIITISISQRITQYAQEQGIKINYTIVQTNTQQIELQIKKIISELANSLS